MNNKSKPQACSVFGIRGAKIMPFLEMTKQNVIYFYPACKDYNLNQERPNCYYWRKRGVKKAFSHRNICFFRLFLYLCR